MEPRETTMSPTVSSKAERVHRRGEGSRSREGGKEMARRRWWRATIGEERRGGKGKVSSSTEPIQTRNLSYQFPLGGVAKSSARLSRLAVRYINAAKLAASPPRGTSGTVLAPDTPQEEKNTVSRRVHLSIVPNKISIFIPSSLVIPCDCFLSRSNN